MKTIAFIGGGNMARALIGGLIARGTEPRLIHVAEPAEPARLGLAAEFGVVVHADNVEAANAADVVVLAVKPQVMRAVCLSLGPALEARRPLILSIAAGLGLHPLRQWLGASARLVRCMPNTPAMLGCGVSGLYAGKEIDAESRSNAEAILSAVGPTVWIEDEALMDAVTAVSGSGPAYFFLMMEAMIDAAIRQGLSEAAARILVLNTAFGAARMAIESDEAPLMLRTRVTSPGGTTQAALERFADGGFASLVETAIARATERGRELAAQFGA